MRTNILLVLVCVCSCSILSASCESIRATAPIPIEYVPQQAEINTLPSPFTPLSDAEKNNNVERELFCGIGFLKEGDLFQAVTALKRAELFAKDTQSSRLHQIEYSLILAHYLSRHYQEVIDTCAKSTVLKNQKTFCASNELQLMLFDSYLHKGQWKDTAQCIASMPPTQQRLTTNLKKYENYMRCTLEELPEDVYKAYVTQAKSPNKAALFNALLPGAGYAYTGENSTALTSFLINAIFIAATYEFAHAGQTGAAIISGSMECGWYFGGAYGAYLSAKRHNEHLYQELAKRAIMSEHLFPIMQFSYGF